MTSEAPLVSAFISFLTRKGGGMLLSEGRDSGEIGIYAFFTSGTIFHFHCERCGDVIQIAQSSKEKERGRN